MKNEGYREPVLILLAVKAGNTCQFEKRVELVCKHIVKAFPKGLYGYETAENIIIGLVGYCV